MMMVRVLTAVERVLRQLTVVVMVVVVAVREVGRSVAFAAISIALLAP
jgi:hypothetical protein